MTKRLILAGIGFALIAGAVGTAVAWFAMRIYVPPGKCAVLIRKSGAEPPRELGGVAMSSKQKGIQREPLGPGRHFRMPVRWEYELHDLKVVPAGDPRGWEWIHSLSTAQRDQLRAGTFKFKGDFPQVGVLTRKIGKKHPQGLEVVTRDSGYQGVIREVLTPGTYKINPYIYEVKTYPAVVIPAGFVGVVTNLQVDPEFAGAEEVPAAPEPVVVTAEGEGDGTDLLVSEVRPLAAPGQRGTLRDVLQPGVYYINPKLKKVTLIEIGFNEYSQVKVSEQRNYRIPFPSETGYTIRVGVTVVWGIDPKHAAEIINEFGNIDGVLDKIIGPQLRSICRNIGSTYTARDFIQGEKREQFQSDLTARLQDKCGHKRIEILIALVREIEIIAPGVSGGGEVTEDLKRTIQQSFVAVEKQITKEKQREAAAVRAQLEEERKKIDIAREQISAETRVLVANVLAEGEKRAAEIDAQADLDVATIQQEVAQLDAQRTEILGQANADVERMKNEAEAKGYKLLVQALGSGHAYNLYTFARNFEPESIRLFFAGDGTFWTDLSRFEEAGAAKLLDTGKTTRP